MIISPRHQFVFVHIPKCAGTSIRHQLRDCDPDHIFIGKPGLHPELGKIDYAHIPIPQLKAHFPEDFAYLRDYESFALVRDPLDRFGSAIRQVLWQYGNQPMTLLSPQEQRQRTLDILEKLPSQIDSPSYQYIFFARQADYIFDGERQLVDHVLPISLVPQILDHFSARCGVKLDRERRSNQNVELRVKGLGNLAFAVNRTARKLLPAQAHTRLKAAALSLIAQKKTAAEASGILDLPEVRDFVSRHYARDLEIFRRAESQIPALRAGLATGQRFDANPV
jgi:hypothetical protein